MRALIAILCLILCATSACERTPPPPEAAPAPPAPAPAAPAPAPAAPPAGPSLTMLQICKDKLTPSWLGSEEEALGALGGLSAACGAGAYCGGEEGFVAIIGRAQAARKPAMACQGCHVVWRQRWRGEHAGARFVWAP